MSYCSASCTSVRSPLIAAIATFALKADVWFRRGLLLMLSPDSRANLARCQAGAPFIALCRFPKPALLSWACCWPPCCCGSRSVGCSTLLHYPLVSGGIGVSYAAPLSFNSLRIHGHPRPYHHCCGDPLH